MEKDLYGDLPANALEYAPRAFSNRIVVQGIAGTLNVTVLPNNKQKLLAAAVLVVLIGATVVAFTVSQNGRAFAYFSFWSIASLSATLIAAAVVPALYRACAGWTIEVDPQRLSLQLRNDGRILKSEYPRQTIAALRVRRFHNLHTLLPQHALEICLINGTSTFVPAQNHAQAIEVSKLLAGAMDLPAILDIPRDFPPSRRLRVDRGLVTVGLFLRPPLINPPSLIMVLLSIPLAIAFMSVYVPWARKMADPDPPDGPWKNAAYAAVLISLFWGISIGAGQWLCRKIQIFGQDGRLTLLEVSRFRPLRIDWNIRSILELSAVPAASPKRSDLVVCQNDGARTDLLQNQPTKIVNFIRSILAEYGVPEKRQKAEHEPPYAEINLSSNNNRSSQLG